MRKVDGIHRYNYHGNKKFMVWLNVDISELNNYPEVILCGLEFFNSPEFSEDAENINKIDIGESVIIKENDKNYLIICRVK